MALPYVDLAGFKNRTLIGASEVDYVEQDSPGYTVGRIAIRTSWIHGRLRKRYGASLPFGDPPPEILIGWIVDLVSLDVMRKRGINPQDPFLETLVANGDAAKAEIEEAANSETGLFDLPSNNTIENSNVTTGGPLGYSETSPYKWMDLEARQGRFEDGNSGNGDI